MTRFPLISILALCVLAGAAGAQAPGPRMVAPPAGWTQQPVKAAAPRPDAASTSVEAYAPAAEAPGPRPAVLYVTKIERKAAPAQRDAIASAELEEIFAAQRRQGAGAKTEASARRADPAAKQLEAALTWRDPSIGMADSTRVVVAADAERVVAVTGECLLGAGATAELAKACDAALATLEPGIPAAARVPLAMTAELAAVEAPPAPAGMGAPTTSAGPAPARLHDATRVELPRQQPPPSQPEADRRPLYLGLGLVVIALVFWWNRRRRERFEAEDERGVDARERERGADERGRGDGDDEDLHAAADEPPAEDPGDRNRKEKDA